MFKTASYLQRTHAFIIMESITFITKDAVI